MDFVEEFSLCLIMCFKMRENNKFETGCSNLLLNLAHRNYKKLSFLLPVLTACITQQEVGTRLLCPYGVLDLEMA
jgi:hypothetical protein